MHVSTERYEGFTVFSEVEILGSGHGPSQGIILELAESTEENCVKPTTLDAALSNIQTGSHLLNTSHKTTCLVHVSQSAVLCTKVTFTSDIPS